MWNDLKDALVDVDIAYIREKLNLTDDIVDGYSDSQLDYQVKLIKGMEEAEGLLEESDDSKTEESPFRKLFEDKEDNNENIGADSLFG